MRTTIEHRTNCHALSFNFVHRVAMFICQHQKPMKFQLQNENDSKRKLDVRQLNRLMHSKCSFGNDVLHG